MAPISLDPYDSRTVSKFPGSFPSFCQKCISAARTLQNVNDQMNAKVEQRVIIKFLSKEEADEIEIHHRLFRAFQEDAYIVSSVCEWIQAFKTGRTSVLDDHRA
jgi:hypothetical protein